MRGGVCEGDRGRWVSVGGYVGIGGYLYMPTLPLQTYKRAHHATFHMHVIWAIIH